MLLTQRLLPLSVLATGLCACATTSLSAQQPVTRAQAAAAALARGARAAFGRADTAVAGAMLHGARLYPNPTAAASYTKDLPHYHVMADLPLDLPWIRSARIGAAASAQDAARYGFAFERAAIRFEVDTMYTRALAALARARLSHRNALDADSLHKMAQLRREVGDVSELDVRLAAVNAGQLENVAADDSVAGMQALLAVQLAMGLPAEEVTIALADSLASPPDSLAPPAGEPLPVAAAAARLRSSERALGAGPLHRRRRGGEHRRSGRSAPRRDRPAMITRAPLLAAALALAACRGERQASAAADTLPGEPAAGAVRTAVATLQPFPQVVTAIGTVTPRPAHFAELSAPGPTRVARIFVTAGQRVAEGDSLGEFERAPFDAAARRAETALSSSARAYARAVRLAQAGSPR